MCAEHRAAPQLRATTRVAAVIGSPVRHSLSPVLHNAAFAALGLDWAYVAFDVAPGQGSEAVRSVRVLGLAGLSVTMPHKTDVVAACDEAADDVAILGAANTVVVRSDGTLRAETTDGAGFVDALLEEGISPEGKRVLVIGAGGAGRAVVLALARARAKEIVIVNRSRARAEAAVAVATSVQGAVARVGSLEEADACSILVNATPQGMGTDATLPLDVRRLGPGQVVNDLVYHPATTPVLAAAAAAGAQPVGGLGMLLHQAGRQVRLWTGQAPPIAVMRGAVEAALGQR